MPRIEAFVLVAAKPGTLWKAVEGARKINGVKLARGVAGRFDVLIHIETDDFSRVIEQIHRLEGVLKTETLTSLVSF